MLDTYSLLSSVSSKMLPNLKGILSKAEADAEARKIEPRVFLQARLAPDMFDLTRQVQVVTDLVKGGFARLAGAEVPSWDDKESSFAELRARIDKTLEYTRTFEPARFADAETRQVVLKFPGATFEYTGRDYLLGFVVPNVYFHVTVAYAILRHNGVPLGKRDFLG